MQIARARYPGTETESVKQAAAKRDGKAETIRGGYNSEHLWKTRSMSMSSVRLARTSSRGQTPIYEAEARPLVPRQ